MQRKKKIIISALATPIAIMLISVVVISVFSPWILKEGLIYIEYVINGRSRSEGVDATKVKVDGIDVSHHNGWIDWNTVAKNKKIKFVYVKATQGVGYVDPVYHRNVRKARKAGMNVGVYHFFTANKSGKKQFEFFRKTVKGLDGNLIPMVDVEVSGIGNMKPKDLQKELGDFCELIRKAYGRKPIIYTGTAVYNNLMGDKFDSYYIWISRYGFRPNLRGKIKHNIWQFTEHGKVEGIGGYTDLNSMEDSMELQKLLR